MSMSTLLARIHLCRNSLFGPDIITSAPGNTVSASDSYATPNAGTTLTSGQTLDLGHVLFALALNAPQTPIPLTFSAYPATGIFDPNGNQFTNVTIPAPGELTIRVGAAVPEPASVLLGLQGWLLLTGYIAYRVRRKRQPANPMTRSSQRSGRKLRQDIAAIRQELLKTERIRPSDRQRGQIRSRV